jgi:hypothetical protein
MARRIPVEISLINLYATEKLPALRRFGTVKRPNILGYTGASIRW